MIYMKPVGKTIELFNRDGGLTNILYQTLWEIISCVTSRR